MTTIKAGTELYHGTDCDAFEEDCEDLNGPAWLSSSKEVAMHFATRRSGWGGQKRIITYRLGVDVHLHEILSARQMRSFAEEHQIDLGGVEGMRESVEQAGIPGWVIPHNYVNGDDILLVNTSVLDFVQTEIC